MNTVYFWSPLRRLANTLWKLIVVSAFDEAESVRFHLKIPYTTSNDWWLCCTSLDNPSKALHFCHCQLILINTLRRNLEALLSIRTTVRTIRNDHDPVKAWNSEWIYCRQATSAPHIFLIRRVSKQNRHRLRSKYSKCLIGSKYSKK